MAYENGPPFAKMKLKALKSDITRGDSFKLVSSRMRDLICPVEGRTRTGRFTEHKEVNRHVRNTHPAFVHPNVQVVEGPPHQVPERNVWEMEGQGAGWNYASRRLLM